MAKPRFYGLSGTKVFTSLFEKILIEVARLAISETRPLNIRQSPVNSVLCEALQLLQGHALLQPAAVLTKAVTLS